MFRLRVPSRLPQEKAFGEKGTDASAAKADNASSGKESSADQTAECAEAKAAIVAAGTGGATGKGQDGGAGADGRAKATEAACSGADVERSSSFGKSTEAPGHTGLTGESQATIRANDHADDGLANTQNQVSDAKKQPEQ
jgi:hypothetical protein